MSILFISDLHLDGAWPEISEQFFAFLETRASKAESLYILGDLFESWVGDDDDDPHKLRICQALRALTDSGVSCYVMHGNRDFMLGADFAKRCGARMLDDPHVIELGGQKVALMHGDTLCTDDAEYLAFRGMVRNPRWQEAMLTRSLDERRGFAAKARDVSRDAMGDKPAEIMDVNQQAVQQAMLKLGVKTLIHGHTHRPAIHEFELGAGSARRIVLGDWYEQGSVLRWDGSELKMETLPRS